MLITIDSHELGITDLQARLVMQAFDKGYALRREMLASAEAQGLMGALSDPSGDGQPHSPTP